MARGGSNAARGNANHPLMAQLSTLYAPGLPFARFGTASGHPFLNLAQPNANSGFFDNFVNAPLDYASTPFGPGLRFSSSLFSSGTAASAGQAPWRPNIDGAYRPVTIFSVYSAPSGGGGWPYGFSLPDAGASAAPMLGFINDSTVFNARHVITFSGGNNVQDQIPSIGSPDHVVSCVYTSRSATDHEMVCYNMNTGQFFRKLPSATVAWAATGQPSEVIGAQKNNLAFAWQFTGIILLCGFGYGGLTSDQAAALARDPFDLLDTQDLADEPSFYVSAATRARRSVIWL